MIYKVILLSLVHKITITILKCEFNERIFWYLNKIVVYQPCIFLHLNEVMRCMKTKKNIFF